MSIGRFIVLYEDLFSELTPPLLSEVIFDRSNRTRAERTIRITAEIIAQLSDAIKIYMFKNAVNAESTANDNKRIHRDISAVILFLKFITSPNRLTKYQVS